MTIEYINNASIINTPAQIIINPVNCVGVMGAGLAQTAYPWSVTVYNHACAHGVLEPGGLVVSSRATLTPSSDDTIIIHLATKQHWKDPSMQSYVATGLKNLRSLLDDWSLVLGRHLSVALPKLGCGCGGLDWNVVNVHIRKHFGSYEGVCYVYT